MIKRQPRISTRQRNQLLKWFALGLTATMSAEEAKVNRNTANLYFNHFRELIWQHYRRAPRFLGEVEMDQTFFGKGIKRENVEKRVMANVEAYGDFYRPRIQKQKKKRVDKKIMVFGILNRGGNVYTHIIKKADRNTLFPIIHMVVEPGSTIYTDKWASYESLKIDGYDHKQVNHSISLVGGEGVHTGNIDSFWGAIKNHLGKFRGLSRHKFALHLKEAEARYNNHEKGKFLKLMRELVKKADDTRIKGAPSIVL